MQIVGVEEINSLAEFGLPTGRQGCAHTARDERLCKWKEISSKLLNRGKERLCK